MTVLPPLTPLSLQGQIKTIREGEQLKLKVAGGATPYKRGNYDATAISYSVDETTGDITLGALRKPGNYTLEVKDKYGQTMTYGLTILDAYLSVTPTVLTLQAGDNATITVNDYYVGLELVLKSNTLSYL